MRRHPGAIKQRLSKMLSVMGIEVSPYDLRVNYGYNTAHHDGCSWNGSARRGAIKVNIFSMDTMTNLVHRGFTLHEWEQWNIELFAKEHMAQSLKEPPK